MRCFVFFGIQGSGKGTQADLLSDSLQFQHVSIGDLFREQISLKTKLGLQVSEIISRGELVPDELVFDIIDQSLHPDRKGIIFDGFPRTLAQAEFLVKHFKVRQVFFLELSEAKAIARISSRRICRDCGQNYNLVSDPPSVENVCDACGGKLIIRNDDKPEAISRRLAEFYEQTLALKDFFAERGLLSEVDAGQEIEGVAKDIREIVASLPAE